jgi:tetratricopeptide (TPR) repeat protein
MSNCDIPLAAASEGAGHARVRATLARADRLFEAGKQRDALLAYEAVLTWQPRNAHVLHRMALACFRDGQPARAREYLDRALNVTPTSAELWEHRGLLAALEGEHVIAEALYHRAIDLGGGTSSRHRNLADVLKLAGRRDEARTHYLKALDLDPTLHHAARQLAAICVEEGEMVQAAHYQRRAWEMGSSRIDDGIEWLKSLSRLGCGDEFEALLAELRAHYRADAAALGQLAFALNQLHCYDTALDVAEQGFAVDPDQAALHHYAAYACHMLGDHARMRHHSAEAARLKPDDAHLQFNLAVALLRDGEFEAGWALYRWHERLPQSRTLVRPDFPEWFGEPLAGRRFLLIGEQGLGDQIQALRYADWLHRRGASVDVWVDAALGEIAGLASGVSRAFTRMPPGPYDFWCRMFRVPARMKLSLDMLPVATSYLRASPEAVEQWRERLFGASRAKPRKRRVGLVWAGNAAYELDRYRSIALATLAPVLARSDIAWFSLQKGSAQDELDRLARDIDMTAPGPQITSFVDTLAIVQTLDLVITVDTSVAHLAGAAGVPVWILLPACTDWRWLTGRTDSPWYPTARLFRQQELGRWSGVMDELQAALDGLPKVR